MPKIIQFLHPSQEAKPSNENDSFIPWNNHDSHRRKFLISVGKYIDENGTEKENQLSFWGEWEAQSDIIKIKKSNNYSPNYFNKPYLDPRSPKKTQTTDPYVFGKRFKYFICRQRAYKNILKNLEENSIVLFGSCIHQKFCLDTAFVVSTIQKRYSRDSIEELIPSNKRGQFYFTSIVPLLEGDTYCNTDLEDEENCKIEENDSFTYYESVDFSERGSYNEMYSFVPCKSYNEHNNLSSIFTQPEIKLDFINSAQTQGITPKECSIQEIKKYWQGIVEQVESRGLLLGTYFKTPERR